MFLEETLSKLHNCSGDHEKRCEDSVRASATSNWYRRPLHSTLMFTEEEKDKLEVLIKKFDEYFLPKENTSFERYKFFIVNKDINEGLPSEIMPVSANIEI